MYTPALVLLLACPSTPAPVEPPAAPAEPPAVAPASTALPSVPDGAIALLTWNVDPSGGCRADVVVLGGATSTIGTIPGPCPEQTWRDASAIRTADGRLLLKTPTGALERSAAGEVVVLPPLSSSWFLDDVGYDAAGKIVAAGRWRVTEANVQPAGDTSLYTWDVDGEKVAYTGQNGDADAAVCGRFPWADGAWGKPVLQPMGLTEGTNTPYCFVGGEGAPEPLPRASDGGPGVSLPVAQVPGGREGEWHVDGVFAMKASEWLEGQNRLGPLYFAAQSPWLPVINLDAPGVLALEVHDTWAIACQANQAAVIDLTSGARKWSDAGCPIAWPTWVISH